MEPTRKICILNGHPDASEERLAHALAAAYESGALAAGHQVRALSLGVLDFPLIRSAGEFASADLPPAIAAAQDAIRWADHLVVIYPLWHGMLPARLKGFLEQVFRHDFSADVSATGWHGKLTGKSARIVVTMGMPALFYRFYFRAHSLHALRMNILGFSGMKPVRNTVLGGVESVSPAVREKWLAKMRAFGARAV